MTSTFDPTAFLDATTEESMSTSSLPCPVGEYPATIKEVKVRQASSSKDPSQVFFTADIFWTIDDPALCAELERQEIVVKQGIFLDITDQGALDCGKGKNAPLGRLREATNTNKPGMPFSLNQLPGRAAKVTVTHRPDKNDPQTVYAEVKAVTMLT